MRINPKILQTSLVCFCIMAISACSQIPRTKPASIVKPNPTSKNIEWKKRQVFLSKKPVWNLNSKIALRYREDHWTFGLKWLQKATEQYVMQINNPVTGAVVAKLSRNNNGVSLLSDDGKVYKDTDEERLLLRQSGVRLPMKGMQSWVRGLTSPIYKVDKLVLDSMGRPQTIYQAGWRIEYSRYLNTSFNSMPRKVVITREKDNVYLKMIAKKWY